MAEYVVIACRANHPNGYGYENGTAHGYSTLLIPVDNKEQLEKVKKRLTHPIWDCFPGLASRAWYGGQFDYVGYVKGNAIMACVWYGTTDPACYSLGDNRAVTIITARSLLNDDPAIAMQKLQEASRHN